MVGPRAVLALLLSASSAYEVVPFHPASSWLIGEFAADPGTIGSGIRVMTGKQATICVPPKAGSEAAHRAFPGSRLEWIGDGVPGNALAAAHPSDPTTRPDGSLAKIDRWLVDSERVRVAIVRHPVERILSSMRAFGVRGVCESCRLKGMKVHRGPDPDPGFERAALYYAEHELRAHAAAPCADARASVNQHFRSQRCFCGLELDGALNRTHLIRFGDDADASSLAAVIPGVERWNTPKRELNGLRSLDAILTANRGRTNFHSTGTRGRRYDPELLRAIEEAVADELTFFRGAGLFLEPLAYEHPP